MKHICFLSSVFGREDALIVYRQGISLIQAGYRVSFLLCDGLPNEVKFGIEMISVGNIQPTQKKRLMVNPSILKNYILSHNYKSDVYQISEPELLPLGLFLKRKGFKVVFNMREYYPVYFSLKFKNKLLSQFVNKGIECYFKHIAKKYDAIFNCMPEMTNYIRNVMPCNYFEDVANYPIIHKDFILTYEEYCSRKNIISYFGTIYNISCQEEFLDAISVIPNVKYLLAGVISDLYKKKLMAKEGWKKVIFKNGFTRDELSCIINCSVIGNVMKDFNQTETPQGSYSIIKIFESMEAAIPVILAKVPLYEEMVAKYHCGICVDPHNVEEIRAAVLYLIEHKREAYEMGQNGRRAVIEKFSWNSQAKGYLNVINELTK